MGRSLHDRVKAFVEKVAPDMDDRIREEFAVLLDELDELEDPTPSITELLGIGRD